MQQYVPIMKAAKKTPSKAHVETDTETAMLRAADSTTPRASVTIANGLKKWRDGISMDQVVELLQSGALDRVDLDLPWDQMEDMLADGVSQDIIRSVKAGADAMQSITSRTVNAAMGVEAELTFDATNRRVAKYIDRSTGRLIQQISRESRQAVKDAVKIALQGNIDQIDTFRAIKRSIPLDSRRAGAVESYRQGLVTAGHPKANQLADAYADRLLSNRADVIARTEMMDAVNQGQLEGMRQARERGWLGGKVSYKTWLVTRDDRTCATCREMSDVKVPIDQPFRVAIYAESAKGGLRQRGNILVDKPPAHPNCRCTTTIQIE